MSDFLSQPEINKIIQLEFLNSPIRDGSLEAIPRVYHRFITMSDFIMAFIQNLKQKCFKNLKYLSKMTLFREMNETQIKYCIRICSGAYGDININGLSFLFLHFRDFFPEEFDHMRLHTLLNEICSNNEKLVNYVELTFNCNYALALSDTQKQTVFINAYLYNSINALKHLLEHRWDSFVTLVQKQNIYDVILKSSELFILLESYGWFNFIRDKSS